MNPLLNRMKYDLTHYNLFVPVVIKSFLLRKFPSVVRIKTRVFNTNPIGIAGFTHTYRKQSLINALHTAAVVCPMYNL